MLHSQLDAHLVKLQADLASFRPVAHRGTKGTFLEKAVRDLMRKILPRRFDVGEGQIVTADGKWAHQADVIVFDRDLTPVLAEQGDTLVVPIESVYLVIEVKASITSRDLDSCAKACEKLKSMLGCFQCTECGQTIRYRPSLGMMMLGLSTRGNLESLRRRIQKIYANEHAPPQQRLNAVYVLGAGALAPGARMGQLPFTSLDGGGERWDILHESSLSRDRKHGQPFSWLYRDLLEFLIRESLRRRAIALDGYN